MATTQDPDSAPIPASEKDIVNASAQEIKTPNEHPNAGFHAGRRLKKLLRPNGRRIHIAANPEEHVHLKRTLPNIEPDDNFDCYIHGSSEHLEAVREIHAHHEQRRLHLRETHGSVYDEFEHVKSELDSLSHELNQLSDHGVLLDANFSKFGYDAHIRTRAPEPSSGSSSISGDHSPMHEKRDWDAERRRGQALKFWKVGVSPASFTVQ